MTLIELREALFDLVARTDYTVSKMNTHINRAMNRIQRVAELPNQEKVIEVTLDSSGAIEIPADMLSVLHMLSADGRSFQRVDISRLLDPSRTSQGASENPRLFSRLRDTWNIKEFAEGEVITIVYHANWESLVEDTDFNEITVQAPDAILYAAAAYAATYFVDTRVKEFEMRFMALKEDLMLQQWNQERATAVAQQLEPVQNIDAYYGGY